jgi:hypothetical protein
VALAGATLVQAQAPQRISASTTQFDGVWAVTRSVRTTKTQRAAQRATRFGSSLMWRMACWKPNTDVRTHQAHCITQAVFRSMARAEIIGTRYTGYLNYTVAQVPRSTRTRTPLKATFNGDRAGAGAQSVHARCAFHERYPYLRARAIYRDRATAAFVRRMSFAAPPQQNLARTRWPLPARIRNDDAWPHRYGSLEGTTRSKVAIARRYPRQLMKSRQSPTRPCKPAHSQAAAEPRASTVLAPASATADLESGARLRSEVSPKAATDHPSS